MSKLGNILDKPENFNALLAIRKAIRERQWAHQQRKYAQWVEQQRKYAGKG